MFDIGASELLLTVIVAIVVIGPKDLPRALRMAGGWLAKFRRVSGHFRSGIEEMIRQAEMEEMEKKWKEKNEAIMQGEAMQEEAAATSAPDPASAEAALTPPHVNDPGGDMHLPAPPVLDPPAHAEAAPPQAAEVASPELPLSPRKAQP
ncbi:MAG: Sec-independent protein translocase protein TatB [Novosphingobium sp.]